jgi:hypothetical protein
MIQTLYSEVVTIHTICYSTTWMIIRPIRDCISYAINTYEEISRLTLNIIIYLSNVCRPILFRYVWSDMSTNKITVRLQFIFQRVFRREDSIQNICERTKPTLLILYQCVINHVIQKIKTIRCNTQFTDSTQTNSISTLKALNLTARDIYRPGNAD